MAADVDVNNVARNTFCTSFFYNLFPQQGYYLCTATDGAARIIPATLCHGVVRTLGRNVPDWDL